jgi:hypothetical protein
MCTPQSNHLRSDRASGDEAAFLLTPIEFRLEHESESLAPVARDLAELCQYVLDVWPRFQEGAAGYGDVQSRYIKLRDALQQFE